MYDIFFVGLRDLPLSALNELLEELEITIKDCSEVLIQELALKDELEYEKVKYYTVFVQCVILNVA